MDRQLSTATGADDRITGPGDPHTQTVQALKNNVAVLRTAGAAMSHTGRARMFLTSIDQWGENEAVLP
jgi:enamine deaminase RidA (YjgF/YER057c/UK114 family)